jgi:hypothetical protein
MNYGDQCVTTQQLGVTRRSDRRLRSVCGTFFLVLLILAFAGTALAQTSLTTIYNFTGVNTDRNPAGDLVMDNQGVLYGVSRNSAGPSKIYQLTPPALVGGPWTEMLLYQGPEVAARCMSCSS